MGWRYAGSASGVLVTLPDAGAKRLAGAFSGLGPAEGGFGGPRRGSVALASRNQVVFSWG